ncbi:hypothetical protein TELCIR_08496, partial [Teladorsagia circumcincta]
MVKLPVCPNGQQSQRRCSVDPECGPRMECSNGGCCPMPFCPTGVQAQMRCGNLNMLCAPGSICMEGLCCPLPRCPNGIISLGKGRGRAVFVETLRIGARLLRIFPKGKRDEAVVKNRHHCVQMVVVLLSAAAVEPNVRQDLDVRPW